MTLLRSILWNLGQHPEWWFRVSEIACPVQLQYLDDRGAECVDMSALWEDGRNYWIIRRISR